MHRLHATRTLPFRRHVLTRRCYRKGKLAPGRAPSSKARPDQRRPPHSPTSRRPANSVDTRMWLRLQLRSWRAQPESAHDALTPCRRAKARLCPVGRRRRCMMRTGCAGCCCVRSRAGRVAGGWRRLALFPASLLERCATVGASRRVRGRSAQRLRCRAVAVVLDGVEREPDFRRRQRLGHGHAEGCGLACDREMLL